MIIWAPVQYDLPSYFQYNLEKPANEDGEEEEEEEEDYGAASARKVEEPDEDPIEGKYKEGVLVRYLFYMKRWN